ncbi:MAG: histidine phosphatase family protein [Ferruginibacter sp.]
MIFFKRFFIVVSLIFIGLTAYSQKNGQTFYIVRHAEKDTGSDPSLSAAGKIRAGDLYRALKNKNIDIIYATKYRRTQMTGDSIKLYKGVPIEIYKADTTGSGLAEKMTMLKEKGKNILIIGHSNTVPAIIRKLGVSDFLKEIPEDEFDNLYIVTIKKGVAQVRSEKYGAK